MKSRFITIIAAASAAIALLASCDESMFHDKNRSKTGTLAFAGLSIGISDESNVPSVETKAVSTSDFIISIYDSENKLDTSFTYSAMPSKLILGVGDYTLKVQSKGTIPAADWDTPVYGASESFSIADGKTTTLGAVTCKLVNIKISVGYNSTMTDLMSSDCKTVVTITEGGSLTYVKGETRAGYFAPKSAVMTVKFSGTVDGSYKTLTKTFSDVSAGQWRKVNFVMTVNPEGTATFTVTIDDWCEEKELSESVSTDETVIGDDPTAGGGTKPAPSLTCDDHDLTKPVEMVKGMTFVVNISAPNRIKTFYVDVSSDNPNMIAAFTTVNNGSTTLDLVNPSDQLKDIFDGGLHFPYGGQVYNKKTVPFDLGASQPFIASFTGTHVFTMRVTDQKDQTTTQAVTMHVSE
jgi:hypothetical protein